MGLSTKTTLRQISIWREFSLSSGVRASKKRSASSTLSGQSALYLIWSLARVSSDKPMDISALVVQRRRTWVTFVSLKRKLKSTQSMVSWKGTLQDQRLPEYSLHKRKRPYKKNTNAQFKMHSSLFRKWKRRHQFSILQLKRRFSVQQRLPLWGLEAILLYLEGEAPNLSRLMYTAQSKSTIWS